jgi:hypothetical protein
MKWTLRASRRAKKSFQCSPSCCPEHAFAVKAGWEGFATGRGAGGCAVVVGARALGCVPVAGAIAVWCAPVAGADSALVADRETGGHVPTAGADAEGTPVADGEWRAVEEEDAVGGDTVGLGVGGESITGGGGGDGHKRITPPIFRDFIDSEDSPHHRLAI